MKIKKSGIYKITGPNGRCYIGQSADIANRWRYHKYHLRKGIHGNGKLQNAWTKYGEASFRFEVILLCSPVKLTRNEQKFMDRYKSAKHGYNIAAFAESTQRGVPNPGTAERNRQQVGVLHPSWGIARPDLSIRNKTNPPCKGKKWKPNRKPTPTGMGHALYRNHWLRYCDKIIVRLLKEGKSRRSIAIKFGTTISSINRISRVNGLD